MDHVQQANIAIYLMNRPTTVCRLAPTFCAATAQTVHAVILMSMSPPLHPYVDHSPCSATVRKALLALGAM